jgi:phosphatidate cytidylyltransferase
VTTVAPDGPPAGREGIERLSLSRVLGAVIGFPALALLLSRGPAWAFALLAAAVGLAAFREVHALLGVTGPWVAFAIAVGAGVGASVAALENAAALAALGLGGVLVFSCALVRRMPWEQATRAASASAFALLYVLVPLALLTRLRARSTAFATLLVLGTWARDIGAFLAGRVLHGAPLRPDLNPRKHLPGALGGLLLPALGLLLARPWWSQHAVADRDAVVLALIIGVFGQAGDLFESLLKRRAMARHSGLFLPGQGGVLDSIDGLLFTAPVAAAYIFMVRDLTW